MQTHAAMRQALGMMKGICSGVLILLALAGCTAISTSSSPTPTTLAQITPDDGRCRIKIGVITSLSGEYQARAIELVRGYDLARDEINAAGGILGCTLELVYMDDASTSIEAERAMQKLAEDEGALLVAGSFASVITLDIVPLSSQYRIPLLAHNSTNSLITDLGYEWVFRTMPSSWKSLDQIIRYISQLSVDIQPTVALLYEDSAYGQDIYVSLLSRLKTYGISLVSALPIPADSRGLAPRLTRLKESGANILVLVGNSVDEALMVMEQLEAANLNFDIYLAPGGAYTSPEFLQSPYAGGIITPFPWINSISLFDEMSDQTTDDFLIRFAERYDAQATHRSVNAYTNIYLAKTAIETVLTTPPTGASQIESARLAIRDALRNMDIEQTLFGPIDFDSSGQNATTVIITQMVDGQLVVISPEALATGDLIFPVPPWAERNLP